MSSPHELTVHVDRASLGFAAAHFGILGEGRERLHGHNYTVALRARGPISERGTVVDFSALKAAVRAECAELDHGMLLPTSCPEIAVAQTDDGHVEVRYGADRFVFPAGDVRLLAVRNTTCECLAEHLLGRLRARLGDLPVGLEVTVEESPGQGATISERGRD